MLIIEFFRLIFEVSPISIQLLILTISKEINEALLSLLIPSQKVLLNYFKENNKTHIDKLLRPDTSLPNIIDVLLISSQELTLYLFETNINFRMDILNPSKSKIKDIRSIFMKRIDLFEYVSENISKGYQEEFDNRYWKFGKNFGRTNQNKYQMFLYSLIYGIDYDIECDYNEMDVINFMKEKKNNFIETFPSFFADDYKLELKKLVVKYCCYFIKNHINTQYFDRLSIDHYNELSIPYFRWSIKSNEIDQYRYVTYEVFEYRNESKLIELIKINDNIDFERSIVKCHRIRLYSIMEVLIENIKYNNFSFSILFKNAFQTSIETFDYLVQRFSHIVFSEEVFDKCLYNGKRNSLFDHLVVQDYITQETRDAFLINYSNTIKNGIPIDINIFLDVVTLGQGCSKEFIKMYNESNNF